MISQITNRIQHAENANAPTQHSDDPDVLAQRAAVLKCVNSLKSSGNIPAASIFMNLRVADSLGQGKTDVDVIIVSGWKVHCLMVRNWSGKINYDKETDTFTIQGGNKVVQSENPISEANRRAELVRTYLNQSGIALTSKQVSGRLVLTNSEIKDETENEMIFNDSTVIRDFDTFAESFVSTWFWTFADRIVHSWFTGALSYTQLTNSHIAFAKLGTFDVAFLTGGRKIVGDLQGSGVLPFQRKEVEEIEIQNKNIGIKGKLKASLGFFPEVACVLWRRGGKGWWFRDKHSTILIPYNQNVTFKIAGESQDAMIPINEIHRIIISK